MSNPTVSKILVFSSMLALAAATGCERRGKDESATREKPDPRLLKQFDAKTPWFCRIPLLYSVEDSKAGTTKTVNTALVATGENKTKTYEALKKACDDSVAEAKELCSPIIAADRQLCVGAPIFNSGFQTPGVWQCEISYTVNDQSETLRSDTFSTVNAAIEDAFKACAELKNDCSKQMIEQKMMCEDLNTSTPIPAKKTVIRHLGRKKR